MYNMYNIQARLQSQFCYKFQHSRALLHSCLCTTLPTEYNAMWSLPYLWSNNSSFIIVDNTAFTYPGASLITLQTRYVLQSRLVASLGGEQETHKIWQVDNVRDGTEDMTLVSWMYHTGSGVIGGDWRGDFLKLKNVAEFSKNSGQVDKRGRTAKPSPSPYWPSLCRRDD